MSIDLWHTVECLILHPTHKKRVDDTTLYYYRTQNAISVFFSFPYNNLLTLGRVNIACRLTHKLQYAAHTVAAETRDEYTADDG
jgi:hypothetical protein